MYILQVRAWGVFIGGGLVGGGGGGVEGMRSVEGGSWTRDEEDGWAGVGLVRGFVRRGVRERGSGRKMIG